MTLQQAKEQVAKSMNFSKWAHLHSDCIINKQYDKLVDALHEAAELYRLESNKERDDHYQRQLDGQRETIEIQMKTINGLLREKQTIWNRACEAQKVICANKARTTSYMRKGYDDDPEVEITEINEDSILKAPNAPYQP